VWLAPHDSAPSAQKTALNLRYGGYEHFASWDSRYLTGSSRRRIPSSAKHLAMAPFLRLPPGCYPPVTERWEVTNEWTDRSTLVTSTRLQPAQWSQDVWDRVLLYTGVPRHARDEFHRRSRSEHRKSRSRSRGRDSSTERLLRKESRSRSRGRTHHAGDRVRQGEYKDHVPSKRDFTVQPVDKKPSQKELKTILKHRDSRIFFDDVRGPYYELNTFSDHPVVYNGYKFPTAEHLLLFFRAS
jgi:hypothetical protein